MKTYLVVEALDPGSSSIKVSDAWLINDQAQLEAMPVT